PEISGQHGRAGAGIFLVPDDLLDEAHGVAAVFLRPREADVSGAVELRLPRAAAFKDVAIGRDAFVLGVIDTQVLGEVRVEPAADLVAEGLLFGGVFEIHFEYSAEIERSGCVVPEDLLFARVWNRLFQ